MPTYEYKCEGCARQWEEFRGVGTRDEPCRAPCVACGEWRVVRDWVTPPVTGVDAALGAGGDFKSLTRKMSRGLPKSARENLERAASLRGRKYGPQ